MNIYSMLFLVWLLVLSLIALVLYRVDKIKARKHKWRIRESTLLTIGFLGGAPGALLGMKCFRHKTKHWFFWAVNIVGLIWQTALLYYLIRLNS